MGTVNLGEPACEFSVADMFPQREAQGYVPVIHYTRIKAGLIGRGGGSEAGSVGLVWFGCVLSMCVGCTNVCTHPSPGCASLVL